MEKLIKGNSAQIGEIRTWAGKKYQKTAAGWKPVEGGDKGGSKKGDEPGKEPGPSYSYKDLKDALYESGFDDEDFCRCSDEKSAKEVYGLEVKGEDFKLPGRWVALMSRKGQGTVKNKDGKELKPDKVLHGSGRDSNIDISFFKVSGPAKDSGRGPSPRDMNMHDAIASGRTR